MRGSNRSGSWLSSFFTDYGLIGYVMLIFSLFSLVTTTIGFKIFLPVELRLFGVLVAILLSLALQLLVFYSAVELKRESLMMRWLVLYILAALFSMLFSYNSLHYWFAKDTITSEKSEEARVAHIEYVAQVNSLLSKAARITNNSTSNIEEILSLEGISGGGKKTARSPYVRKLENEMGFDTANWESAGGKGPAWHSYNSLKKRTEDENKSIAKMTEDLKSVYNVDSIGAVLSLDEYCQRNRRIDNMVEWSLVLNILSSEMEGVYRPKAPCVTLDLHSDVSRMTEAIIALNTMNKLTTWAPAAVAVFLDLVVLLLALFYRKSTYKVIALKVWRKLENNNYDGYSPKRIANGILREMYSSRLGVSYIDPGQIVDDDPVLVDAIDQLLRERLIKSSFLKNCYVVPDHVKRALEEIVNKRDGMNEGSEEYFVIGDETDGESSG